MKYLIGLVSLLTFMNCASTQNTSNISSNNKSGSSSYDNFDYDVTCDVTGKDGTQLMVVSTIASNEDQALKAARWQGVHAIIYKGLNSGACVVPPLVDMETYQANKLYFDTFFSTGGFTQFVVSASDYPVDLFYVNKKSVKVFSNVTVNRDALRQQLIKDQILKSLGDIF
jgi:hypothetical protein